MTHPGAPPASQHHHHHHKAPHPKPHLPLKVFNALWADYQVVKDSKMTDEARKTWGNTCAIKMSKVLMDAGIKLPKPSAQGRWNYHESGTGHVTQTFYIRSHELVEALMKIWANVESHAHDSKTFLGKKGILYFHHAYAHGVGHIDVWDGAQIGSSSYLTPPFDTAKMIIFIPAR